MSKKTMAQCCDVGKMCAMTCCPCNIDIKKLKPLVDNPRFICKQCGRVANVKKNLCKPVKL
jgi:hypothetical protein